MKTGSSRGVWGFTGLRRQDSSSNPPPGCFERTQAAAATFDVEACFRAARHFLSGPPESVRSVVGTVKESVSPLIQKQRGVMA